MQEQMPCLFCVVDMHAITADAGYGKPSELAQSTREVTAAYIAAGVDPKRSPIFNQGQVPEHGELAWIFNCVARLGWLDRMTQFKEKSGKHKERASVGLYTYPVLMAADILVYKATHVPVGEDQKQHLELARDIAAKFNNDFGVPDFFPQPEPVITGTATRVMSLRDGTKKMSKSDESDMSRINLTDDIDTIANKIRRAKTDSGELPEDEKGFEGRPEASNLINIYAALAEKRREEIIAQFAGQVFSTLKGQLTDLAVAKLAPVTERMNVLMADPGEIDKILKDGAHRARAIATPIMDEVKKRVGFIT
jgi:tryptophanyl-tRNA synthetase